MSLFPLPAIIFLCCLILLLIVIAILYFTVLKKGNLCHCMEGHGGVEEGEPLTEPGTETGEPSGSAKTEGAATGATTGGGGGGEGAPPDTVDGGGTGEPAMEGELGDPELTSEPPQATPSRTLDEAPAPATPAEGGEEGEGGGGEAEEPLCVAGKMLLQFTYMPAANKINLTVIRVADMPSVERGGAENIRVHLCVLPERKQRFRTKVVPVSKGVFNETFQFIHMTIDVVENCAIRLRVYGAQRFSSRVIGEAKIPLSKVDLTSPLSDEQIWKNLSPKGFVNDEDEIPEKKSTAPTVGDGEDEEAGPSGAISAETLEEEEQPPPELLLNFYYVDLTGRLSVEVIKGLNFRLPHMIVDPTSFVKIKVISGKGKKIGKSKTSIRLFSNHPEFNETFIYPISPVDLKTATMMVTVYMVGKRGKRQIIGWFALGQNTSGPDQTQHWKDMIDNPDKDVPQWHELQVAG